MLSWLILLLIPPVFASALLVAVGLGIYKLIISFPMSTKSKKILVYVLVVLLALPIHFIGVMLGFVINGYLEQVLTGLVPEYGYATSGLYLIMCSTVFISTGVSLFVLIRKLKFEIAESNK